MAKVAAPAVPAAKLAWQALPLSSPAVAWSHAAALEDTPHGVLPLRFTPATLATMEPFMARIARMGTGIELQLAGPIHRLELTLTLLDHDDYGLQVELWRGPYKLLPVVRLKPVLHEPQVLEYQTSSRMGMEWPLRLLLPTHCTVAFGAARVQAAGPLPARFTLYDFRAHCPPGLTWLIHGDSITQGANVSSPAATWANLAARDLALCPVNLGIGGYGKAEACIAEHLASRPDGDLLSLHLGANCAKEGQIAEFGLRLAAMLRRIRASRPTLPVVLVTPLAHHLDGPEEFDPPLMPQVRDEMRQVVRAAQAAGDTRVFLIEGYDLLDRLDYGFLADGVHVNDLGAHRIASRLAARLEPIIRTCWPTLPRP